MSCSILSSRINLTLDMELNLELHVLHAFPKSLENSILPKCHLQPCSIHMTNYFTHEPPPLLSHHMNISVFSCIINEQQVPFHQIASGSVKGHSSGSFAMTFTEVKNFVAHDVHSFFFNIVSNIFKKKIKQPKHFLVTILSKCQSV